jgi:hypothetical protein
MVEQNYVKYQIFNMLKLSIYIIGSFFVGISRIILVSLSILTVDELSVYAKKRL